ncbi:MAG TPA: GPW/gp25 family protein [Vicinamibacterales bacterium]|nr:GPW/gp25 family protein [Vicinamibacterales bacterium]
MNDGQVFGQGISFPPRVGPDGRVAWSAGPDNIREMIRVVLMTDPGERVQLPDFGGRLRPLLFEPNTVATRRLVQEQIEIALQLWEPRIAIKSVTVDADAADARAAIAVIDYQLVASQTDEQLTLRVPLRG